MLMGTYLYPYGMSVMVSERANGEYKPQKKNFALLSNQSFMHAYFMRIVDVNGEKYVNHHVLLRETNEFGRNTTMAAPLKAIEFDKEDILRLKWAALNETMKGEKISDYDLENGFVLEYRADDVAFHTETEEVRFRFDFASCGLRICENGVVAEDVCKEICVPDKQVRILYRNTLCEVYLDDYFVGCYTFKGKVKAVETKNESTIWRIK